MSSRGGVGGVGGVSKKDDLVVWSTTFVKREVSRWRVSKE